MTIAIAIGFIVAVLGTAAAFMVPKYLAARELSKQWQRLPSFGTASVLLTPEVIAAGVTVHHVDLALALAVTALIENGPWSKISVIALANELQILVDPHLSWVSTQGQHVAGQTYFKTVKVGLDLAALCHELAHVCEEFTDGRVDMGHERWAARGIYNATNAYEKKLGVS